jgi:hypothetical protein
MVAWAGSAGLLGAGEWALLQSDGWATFSGPAQILRLLLVLVGHWLPYAGLALVGWRVQEAVLARLSLRASPTKARLLTASGVAALLLPYSLGLARYTFSGPQARVWSHHAAWVAGFACGLSLWFATLAWLAQVRHQKLARRVALCVASASLAWGALWLSRTVQPDEYEPLHVFLAFSAVLGASLFGRQVASAWGPPSVRFELRAGVGLASLALLSGVYLARNEVDSWLIWSSTGGARYLTERWSFLTPKPVLPERSDAFVARPALESELTAAWRRRRAAKPPHIVIFSIDGMLPGHVGAYGYTKRATTPNIDRVAARGVRFTRAYSAYPATLQFNSSLLLGRFVPWGGAPRAPTAFREHAITRLLHEQGYHILVKSWFESSSEHRFDPAYFQIDTNLPKANAEDKAFRLELPMQERMARIEKHLEEAEAKQQPVFLWMHLLGSHPVGGRFVADPAFPYGDSRAERYDSAVAGMDRWLPEVERLMQAHADPSRDTIWIICSDHGKYVDANARGLKTTLMHIPLIIAGPEFRPAVREELVEGAVDLAATVLDLAGIERPRSYDGISLVPLLKRGEPDPRFEQRFVPLMGDRGARRGAAQGAYTLLTYKRSVSFFDLRSDPLEQHNIYAESRALADPLWGAAQAELERRLVAFEPTRQSGSDSGTDVLDEE